MTDIIEKIGRSIIQHGPHNQRVYLMKLHHQDAADILPALDRLAHEKQYEKILAKVPAGSRAGFERRGYIQEALIPAYFKNGDSAIFMCKYLSASRAEISAKQQIQDILYQAKRREQNPKRETGTDFPTCQVCGPADAGEMSSVFRRVFKTYPFPIFDAAYLADVMNKELAQYVCIRKDAKIVAIAAAEVDTDNRGVEMTDFVTLPEFQGRGHAGILLQGMERAMTEQGMRTAFSIARALSPAMNILFAREAYIFGGTLINNTQIAGHVESMNVWHKHL
jgi:beta-lysine N6-acetyltransferase